jgi:predicted nucleotidyltransferase
MTTDYARVLKTLTDGGVEFVLIGGVAANLHGSARATFDVDVVYSRGRANIARLVKSLAPFRPYLRGAPPGLPFQFDEATIRNGLNFTLDTTLGDIDVLGEVAGGGNYSQLLPNTVEMEAFGIVCKCVTLERLIQLKRAAGRPKDFESLAELQLLLENRRKREQGSAS